MKKINFGSLNKEFIPLLLVVVTPFLAFMQGYGVNKLATAVDYYLIVPCAFALLMNILEKRKIRNIYFFILLLTLDFAISTPYINSEKFIGNNMTYLVISYELIIFYFYMVSLSFFRNDPYFAEYYTTQSKAYLLIYRITGVFFAGTAIYHIVLFTRIILILRTVWAR
jgi:hypothetical protein